MNTPAFLQRLLRRVLDELGATGAAAMVGSAGVAPPVPHEPPPPRGDELRRFIADAIEAVASEGNVVIGAHAASFALGARDDVLRVFVSNLSAADDCDPQHGRIPFRYLKYSCDPST